MISVERRMSSEDSLIATKRLSDASSSIWSTETRHAASLLSRSYGGAGPRDGPQRCNRLFFIGMIDRFRPTSDVAPFGGAPRVPAASRPSSLTVSSTGFLP
jgi:hypothetical protein